MSPIPHSEVKCRRKGIDVDGRKASVLALKQIRIDGPQNNTKAWTQKSRSKHFIRP